MTNRVPQAGSEAGHRLFLGLEMPAFVQEQLADLRTELPGVRWQWPADLHLTLRFLGSVPERLMAHIIWSTDTSTQLMDGFYRLPTSRDGTIATPGKARRTC